MFKVAIFIVLAYTALCALLYLIQRSQIYFPQPRSHNAPEHTQTLLTADGKLVLSSRAMAGPQAVIYFGGNGEDVSNALADLMRAFPQHALYLLHYRGYGGSEGKPSEAALHADALALYEKVSASHSQVTVIGRSLGTCVAVRLASLKPIKQLVLVTPFYSLQELAAQLYPVFPVRWLLKDKFESWRYVPQIHVPTTILLAEFDEMIPVASSKQLIATFAPGIAQVHVLPDTDHNTILLSPQYPQMLHALP